jgi:hypothetical protein
LLGPIDHLGIGLCTLVTFRLTCRGVNNK